MVVVDGSSWGDVWGLVAGNFLCLEIGRVAMDNGKQRILFDRARLDPVFVVKAVLSSFFGRLYLFASSVYRKRAACFEWKTSVQLIY